MADKGGRLASVLQLPEKEAGDWPVATDPVSWSHNSKRPALSSASYALYHMVFVVPQSAPTTV